MRAGHVGLTSPRRVPATRFTPPGYVAYRCAVEGLRPPTALRDSGVLHLVGTGHSFHDDARALAAARSEAVERACLVGGIGSLRVASDDEIHDRPHVCVADLPRCAPAEIARNGCPLVNATGDQVIRWTIGWSMTRRCEVLVPTVLSQVGLDPLPGERFVSPTSTGAACHPERPAAVLGGLLEVWERHCASLAWLTGSYGERLLDHGLGDWQDAIRYLRKEHGIRTILRLLCLDGPPVVGCLQLDDRAGSQFAAQTVTTAAGPTLDHAVRAAVLESVATREGLLARARCPRGPEDFRSVIDAASLMAHRNARRAFDRWASAVAADGDNRASTRHGAGGDSQAPTWHGADRVVAFLGRHGAEVIVVDLGRTLSANLGLHVVKVVVPQLLPMPVSPLAQYLETASRWSGIPVDRLATYPQPFG